MEELSKFLLEEKKKKKKRKGKKKKKKTLKRQSKCHVFVKQVCFSYGESPRTPPLEGTSLHRRNISVERPWGILSLFTACLPLWVKSSRQSRCHVSPTQELIACILTRQCSPARKNRTRRKKSAVEDARKIPEKNKKNEVPEQSKKQQTTTTTKYIKNSPGNSLWHAFSGDKAAMYAEC